jgi:hypothetical protein
MSGRGVDSARLQATDDLLGRITSILDAARGQVVRAVNHATVSAYWHIAREVVEALQQGGERATYGNALIERLAHQLTDRYGKGFFETNLGYFRQFYLAYRDRRAAGSTSVRTVRGATHPFGRDSFSFQPLKQSSAQIQVIFNHQDVHGESVSRGALRFAKGSVMHNSEGHDKDCENASIQNFALLMRHSRRLFRR